MEQTERLIADYTAQASWQWNLMLQPNLDMVRPLIGKLKTAAPGHDGISNLAGKFGDGELAYNIMDLAKVFFY